MRRWGVVNRYYVVWRENVGKRVDIRALRQARSQDYGSDDLEEPSAAREAKGL